jgi:hypothetical protein
VVDLIGPCEFEMTGPNRGKLATGRIAAYVPERARGFTLDLPNGGRLVDLGTRFELRVDETGSTLQVFEGRVELHWTSVPGDTQVRTLTPGALVKLIDGRLLPAVIDLDIVNASFERPIVSGRSYVDHLDGWAPAGAAVNGGVNRYGPDFAEAVPDGAQLAFLNAGAIEQTLDSYLAPGVCYTLSLAVGNRPGANSPDYTVELYAGQTLLVAATNPILPSKGRFARAQLVFDCPSDHPALGRPLRIVLRSGGSLATHVQNHFDDIRLTVESSDPQEPPAPEGSANLPPHGD